MLSVRQLTLFSLLICILAATSVRAAQPVPAAPRLSAPSYLLVDFNSGYVMAEENIDQRLEPASLTKMMTAYVVYHELASGKLSKEDTTVVSEKAWRMGGSRMFIEVDKEVLIGDLVKGLIVQSGNDASVALAEAIAGSEQQFADYMNTFAEQLGMTGSNFVNSTGLPDEQHYTTARDMGILARALIREFPEEYKLYAEREYTFNSIRQYNRNKLLWRDKSVDGIKTGHTEAAGYCLVASAQRDAMRVISVVMGASSEKVRTKESQRLLDYAFRFYKSQRIYAAEQTLDSPRIWKGEVESLPLGLSEDLFVTVPRGQTSTLKTSLQYHQDITAPVKAGERLGILQVTLGEEVIAERPLVALTSVDEGGIFQRAIDTLLQYLR
ncbi:MAG: D-alanyl-D-alanine carboxypeptidase family protein [Pseudomonadota bacterium]